MERRRGCGPRGAPRNRAGRLAACAALVGALVGCAASPEAESPELPPLTSVLLLPIGFDVAVPTELEPGVAVVSELIARVLWEQDLRVEAPAADALRSAWHEAQKQAAASHAGAAGDPARVGAIVAAFAAGYARTHDAGFDALLIPSLVTRQGTVVGQSVRWDGTSRRLPLESDTREATHIEARRRLGTTCSSLRVLAYDRDGRRLFERYGGLEVALRMKIVEGSWSWTERGDLFRNRQDLEAGVRIALRPLLRD